MSRSKPILLAVSLFAMTAAAQKSRVVIVPFVPLEGATDSAASKFTTLVSDELKTRSDGIDVVAGPVTKANLPEKAASASSSSKKGPSPAAAAALDNGKKAFDDLRFEDAVKDLRRGLEGELSDPATADYEGVIDGYLKLAAALFRMGEEKDAKSALLDLVRMNPAYELPPGYPPVFARELEKAKKRLDKQPRGQISIEGPAGATAFVDGRDLGMVPALDENVPAGMHYVKVEAARGGEKFGQAVEVKGTVTKVKATFGAAVSETGTGTRAPVNMAGDPKVSEIIDDATMGRLQSYAKAAGAEYALFGVVYKISDTQLQAGLGLLHVKRNVLASLAPVTFDTDVLTANTEAFKLCDEIVKRTTSLGAVASIPLNLLAKKASAAVAVTDVPVREPKKNPDDPEVKGPPERKVVVAPRGDDTPKADPTHTIEGRNTLIELKPDEHPGEEPPPPVVKSGVPVWVWVVAGVAVVGGASVGGYFAVSNATKPVTGTVNATW